MQLEAGGSRVVKRLLIHHEAAALTGGWASVAYILIFPRHGPPATRGAPSMHTEILDRFDVATRKGAGVRLRAKSGGACTGHLERAVDRGDRAHGGRYALAARSQTLHGRAEQSREGRWYTSVAAEARRGLYARMALWPFLFAADREAYATNLAAPRQRLSRAGNLTERLYLRMKPSASPRGRVTPDYWRTSASRRRPCVSHSILKGRKQVTSPLEICTSAQRYLSTDPSIHLRLADCALAGRDFPGALAEVEKAAAIAPTDYEVAMKKVKVLLSLGREADALAIFNPTLLPKIGLPAQPEPRYDSRRYDPNFALAWTSINAYPQIGADLALRLGLDKEAETFVFAMKPTVLPRSCRPRSDCEYYARSAASELQNKPVLRLDYFPGAIRWLENTATASPRTACALLREGCLHAALPATWQSPSPNFGRRQADFGSADVRQRHPRSGGVLRRATKRGRSWSRSRARARGRR